MDGISQPLQPHSGLHGVAERLREAVRRHPRKMTLQLAREFGVPEAEVIRAFPGDRAVELVDAQLAHGRLFVWDDHGPVSMAGTAPRVCGPHLPSMSPL